MYSVKHKIDITYQHNFQAHCALVRAEQEYCKTLHYLDYRNHANINLLPSYHPYWSFQVYLGLKQLIVSKLRTIKTYNNMLADKLLKLEIRFRIESVTMDLHNNVQRYIKEAKQLQIKFKEKRI